MVADIPAAGGAADVLAANLRDAASAHAVAHRAVERGNGQVDILINHAGISPFGPTHAMTENVFDRVYALNVKVPSCLVAALAPRMAQRGTGAIVAAEGVCARGTTASAQSRQARSPRRCRRRGDRITDPRSPPLRGRRGHR
jgi:NAD(P)-dependent dehydrogenase (short-subunit alcohol dehydrogenase family)